jgi:ribosomal-protein-alanine N-acetyltransferase
MKPSKRKLRNIPLIDLGDIYLRAVVYNDYNDMFDYGSDPEVTKNLFWDRYQTIDDAQKAVKENFLVRPVKNLPAAYAIVVKGNNKMIGTCDFFFIDWDRGIGEMGYCLNKAYWGRGYATKACRELIKFGFNYLKLDKIIIRHHQDNIGSKRVIEKNGFIYDKDVFLEKTQSFYPTYYLNKKRR